MEEQAPPVPPHVEEVGGVGDEGSGNGAVVVDVTLKRKTVHTNVTVVESATRFWLSAQVMVACILMGLLALSIHNARNTISEFPDTFNSSCVSATYDVKSSIEDALTVMLDDAVNITNTEYQNAVNLTRNIVSRSMNMSLDIFLLVLKNVNPLVYCTIDSGLAMMQSTKDTLRNLGSDIPSLSCPIDGTDIDICQDATDELQTVASSLSSVLGTWPDLPPDLTTALDDVLAIFNVDEYVNSLANFPAPPLILTVNSSDIIQKAIGNATAFVEIATTCTDVSVKFGSTTHHVAKIMYYVEIAIWVAIVALLVGIFLVAVIRQFPTVVVDWIAGKIEFYTNKWNNRLDEAEKNTVRTWQLYVLWTLKYINFKKAILTTIYGLIGIILVLNLTTITNGATQPVEIWVNTSLGPGINHIQVKLQDGINQVIDNVQTELNYILQDQILTVLVPANGTLSEILTEKDKVINIFNNITTSTKAIPVIGPAIANGLSCMLPIGVLEMVNTAIDLMITFMQEMISAQLTFPRLSFPDMSAIAVSATHVVVTQSVEVIQAELQQYLIIFIILASAFGILVAQGLLFVALRRIAIRIKKQRRLTRMKSQSKM